MKRHRLFVPRSMIPALVAGTKTRHRVLMREQPPEDATVEAGPHCPTLVRRDGEEYPGPEVYGCFSPDGDWAIACPYQPGDEVWVPETWRPWWDEDPPAGQGLYCVVQYRTDSGIYKPGTSATIPDIPDECRGHQFAEACDQAPNVAWRAPVAMPSWASRLWYTVAGVRVQRVQDITADDVEKNGVQFAHMLPPIVPPGADLDKIANAISRSAYSKVYDATHGPGAWDRNDWVWVLDLVKTGGAR